MNTVNPKILIGITGVISSGKSLLTNYLRALGYFCLSADEVNHELLKDITHIKHINRLLFNEDKTTLNKKRIKTRIFNDPIAKQALEKYLHPLIKDIILAEIDQSNEKIIFVEVPLLFESGYDFFNKVITVYLDEPTIIKRLLKRDKITKEMAKKIIESQMSIDEKVNLSDYVIDNSKSINYTKQQANELLKELEKEYGNIQNK